MTAGGGGAPVARFLTAVGGTGVQPVVGRLPRPAARGRSHLGSRRVDGRRTYGPLGSRPHVVATSVRERVSERTSERASERVSE